MKRLVFVLLFLFLLQNTLAVPVISDDFYLNNGALHDSDAVVAGNILPNTLRLVLSEGEQGVLRADIIPEDTTERELLWSLPEHAGKIDIYPNGESCTVVGIKEGEENILVETKSGASASVAVEVKKAPEIRTRSFNYEEKTKKPTGFTDGVMRTIVRILIILGAALVFCAVLTAVKRRGEKKDEK